MGIHVLGISFQILAVQPICQKLESGTGIPRSLGPSSTLREASDEHAKSHQMFPEPNITPQPCTPPPLNKDQARPRQLYSGLVLGVDVWVGVVLGSMSCTDQKDPGSYGGFFGGSTCLDPRSTQNGGLWMQVGPFFGKFEPPAGDGDFIGVVGEPTGMDVDEETSTAFCLGYWVESVRCCKKE